MARVLGLEEVIGHRHWPQRMLGRAETICTGYELILPPCQELYLARSTHSLYARESMLKRSHINALNDISRATSAHTLYEISNTRQANAAHTAPTWEVHVEAGDLPEGLLDSNMASMQRLTGQWHAANRSACLGRHAASAKKLLYAAMAIQ